MCKLYLHEYLTLDFTNMAVHRLLLADFFVVIKFLHASFFLVCTQYDFALQMEMQSFP